MQTASNFSIIRWSDGNTAPIPVNEPVALIRDGSIAHIVLNRPHRRNALDAQMWSMVSNMAKELADDGSIKVVTLRGAGDQAFSAGADINEFKLVYSSSYSANVHNALIRETQKSVANLRQPTIAIVRGNCVGGGCILALACDLRFASYDAQFAVPPARIGAVYGFPETRRLVSMIGPNRAKDLLFSARTIKGEEALRIGLVDYVAAPTDVEAMAADYGIKLLKNSWQSIQLMKSMVDLAFSTDTDVVVKIEKKHAESFHGTHFREGYTAFIEKRAPDFR